jgi:single-stranded-DNA-specific exonuclease
MAEPVLPWQIQPTIDLPAAFLQAVQQVVPHYSDVLAQLLWQRGIRESDLAGFLDPDRYQPTSPFAFGEEMQRAIDRLVQAREQQEIVAIWGDFDADGVTATAVLWEGLGQFFQPQTKLFYYIPNRLTESHGLSESGIKLLQAKGCRLIITCDTGSTNLAEIEFAQQLGIDVIVTDHHTLPIERPPVTAIVNPRSLPVEHPLASLSGVAVAYKLVEALYASLPDVPQKPLVELLDLVAIGLIADLVDLKGDCRYLAQRGIAQLQKQANPITATRPGITKLLELCKRSGDRPTDISFGLGPRINAVSRIQGDTHFCIELLTSQDVQLCTHLAEATELANTRRKALQKDVLQQVRDRLQQLDLSTTDVILLADEQWQLGVLGLVAGQIAQEYGRPTILLSTETTIAAPESPQTRLARGSARSVNNIDLYQLVKEQEHLLHRFGGHPYAAGLSLPIENLPLFTEAMNQQLRQRSQAAPPGLRVDLVVTVAELGKDLFQALKLLEPCGMGNPVPKLLIQNAWCEKIWHKKIQDWQGRQVQYIKTELELWDDSAAIGFAGIWWGHYRDEVPQGRCDVVIELDSNNFKKRYEARIIAFRDRETALPDRAYRQGDWMLDYRQADRADLPAAALVLSCCPSSWVEMLVWCRRSQQEQRPLALVYAAPTRRSPVELWQKLVGIAKYLSRTGKTATRIQLLEKLEISDRTLQFGFKGLTQLGFQVSSGEQGFQVSYESGAIACADAELTAAIEQFRVAVQEEQFRQQYFYQVPVATVQAIAAQMIDR